MKRNNIDDAKLLALLKNGKCLSKKYINSRINLKWECEFGHTWFARYSNIQKGTWCPQCAGTNKKTINDAQKSALLKNGKCLSKEYINSKEKLKWECEFGHTWNASLSSVQRGSWCSQCAGKKKKTIGDVHKLAILNKGKCLSKKYISNEKKLEWECEFGHTWSTSLSNVQSGSWCPYCSGNVRKTIDDAKSLAKAKNGKCLSKKYVNNRQKLEWECEFGHTWFTSLSNVQRGSWCPQCSSGLYERICRIHFEQMLGKSFPKRRPPWLRNNNGNLMELDGYCEELKIAFEHNGRQHYENNTIYSSGKIKQNDKEKIKLCEKHDVKLIIVPELNYYLKIRELEGFIKYKCDKYNIIIPSYNSPINYNKAYFSSKSDLFIQSAQEIAIKRGGKCLSFVYKNAKLKLEWECKFGHIWNAIYSNVRNGTWCPICAIQKRIKDPMM